MASYFSDIKFVMLHSRHLGTWYSSRNCAAVDVCSEEATSRKLTLSFFPPTFLSKSFQFPDTGLRSAVNNTDLLEYAACFHQFNSVLICSVSILHFFPSVLPFSKVQWNTLAQHFSPHQCFILSPDFYVEKTLEFCRQEIISFFPVHLAYHHS